VDEIARDVFGFALPKDRIVLGDGATGATLSPK